MSVWSDPDWSSSCLLLRRSHCSIAPPIRDRDKRVGVLRTHHPFRATYVGYVRNWETLPVESLAHIRFDIGLGLPVYVGQLGLPGHDADLLAVGRQLEGKSCASPVGTTAAEWQIAGRKIWNWGEKNQHIRDARVVGDELLAEPGLSSLIPKMRALPAQRVAVIGHSALAAIPQSSAMRSPSKR